MRRREFITLLGGAAAAWPTAARAQPTAKVWRIGLVFGGAQPRSLESSAYGRFLLGMHELGYSEGRDFTIEWRFAEGKYERFAEFGREFAHLKLDIIVTGISGAIPVLRDANPGTPIIMGYSTDPVGQGLIASLARPGGNITGLSSAVGDIVSKQVDLLMMAVPQLSRIAVLSNPANRSRFVALDSAQAAGRQAGVGLVLTEAREAQDIERAFDTVTNERAGALIVIVDAFFFGNRQKLAALALHHRLPTIFSNREYCEAGGLMSYGDSIGEFFRRAASYVDKVIKGAKPGDLPVQQPTNFHLVINRKTADALGLTLSPQLLVFANEVIE